MKMRIARFRALVTYSLIAMAQFLSPAAAADPASKIDPPAWSYKHSQEELQAYGMRVEATEADQKTRQSISQAKLRRMISENRARNAD